MYYDFTMDVYVWQCFYGNLRFCAEKTSLFMKKSTILTVRQVILMIDNGCRSMVYKINMG